jgi:plasmid stabilization system protein ParE
VTYRIEYSAAARRDLVGIGNYVREQAGDLTAERLLGRIIDQAENLQFMPQRYRARDELQAGLRLCPSGSTSCFTGLREIPFL